MSNDIKFTVIIPTRERADVLVHCLRTVVAQDYENLEIIVSDNHSNDNTREVVESFRDERIRYINTGRRLSMSSNWEYALSFVSEGYVGFLGDDDGLLPGSIARLSEIIDEYCPDAINAPYVDYNWPDNGTDEAWKICVPSRRTTKYYSSAKYISDLLSGYLSYVDGPLIYNGSFAKIDKINAARDHDRVFFKAQSPDVYSAVALSCVTSKFLRIKDPIAVAGRSRHSNGSSAMKKGAPPGPFQAFMKENDLSIHSVFGSLVPESIQLLCYDSYLQASHLHRQRSHNLGKQLTLAVLLAEPQTRERIADQCCEIAKLNSLLWAPSWRLHPLASEAFLKYRSLRNGILGVKTRIKQLDGKDFGLDDVHKVALAYGTNAFFSA
ncbi:MAG: hypothetical protein AMXMBFR76_19760 [Pseudomonadota bacterium]